jgi:hypothetical protein
MNNKELYISVLKSAHELLKNCQSLPVNKNERANVVTGIERILFPRESIPAEFRKVSDLYIAKGLVAL